MPSPIGLRLQNVTRRVAIHTGKPSGWLSHSISRARNSPLRASVCSIPSWVPPGALQRRKRWESNPQGCYARSLSRGVPSPVGLRFRIFFTMLRFARRRLAPQRTAIQRFVERRVADSNPQGFYARLFSKQVPSTNRLDPPSPCLASLYTGMLSLATQL